MKYIDYDLDMTPDRVVLDEELDLERLGWKRGDYFKVDVVNGRTQLTKIDELEKFIRRFPREET